jgi:IS30 family transposase
MIPMRVPLALRPRAVDSRRGFGHFESDTVIGSAPSRTCIDTQVERRTRKLFARLMADKSAPETAKAEYAIYSMIPAAARIDRTWDNGTESALHRLVDEALGMLTYYADPYSLWQRGSNENRNGRIRRYLPKRTSLENLTQAELDDIVAEINDTPMKRLGYHTPNEAWQEEISKLRVQSQPASHKHSQRCTSK